jgi:hypothetical protein
MIRKKKEFYLKLVIDGYGPEDYEEHDKDEPENKLKLDMLDTVEYDDEAKEAFSKFIKDFLN